MNIANRARLIGMILGDGCLKLKARGYVEFVMDHSPKQLEYLEHKRDLLHSIMGGKEIKIRKESKCKGKYESYRMSKQHKYFQQLRRLIYSDGGKKYFTPAVLEKLNAEALAYWYMDDGSLVISLNKEGNVSSFQVRLYTYCLQQEALNIQAYLFKAYNIKVKVSKYNRNNSYNIKMNTTEGKKFLALTEKYKVPCMAYKWDTSSKTRVRNISQT